MPIRAIENPRLYRQIADQISALIASGELAPGARLPSERDLAVQLGVSRPSVREALIALEVAGKVEVRVGAGIYVAPLRPLSTFPPASEGQGPFELLRARWLIEGEIAMEAGRRARPEDLEPVRAAVIEMQRIRRHGGDVDAPDREFHLSVARASHNSALVAVVQNLWDQGRGSIWRRMEEHFQTPQLLSAVARDHRAILDALEQRDGRGARRAMREHLERVDHEFSRSWEELQSHEKTRAARASHPRAR